VWLLGYTTIAWGGDQVCYRKLEVYSEDWDAQESLVTEQPGISENYLLPAPSKLAGITYDQGDAVQAPKTRGRDQQKHGCYKFRRENP
jgi:hypothetical protein